MIGRFGTTFVLLVALVGSFAIPATPARAQPPQLSALSRSGRPPLERNVGWRRVGPDLTAVHDMYQQHLATRSGQPFDPGIPFLAVSQDMVIIDAVADDDVSELVAALEQLGAVEIVTFRRMVSARLPLSEIPALADLEWLRLARPAMARTWVGNTTSQGDAAMRTDDARTTFGVNGAGMTVGVLSDTFDCGGGSYATDIGTADLPAGIEVLDDDPCGIDEGRGMLQLIHDVAPGADLSFHTAFGGQAGFASGIQELAGCPPGSEVGCTPASDPAEVLVDDVGYFATPMFQDGIIAQAVDVVAAAGVPYFSSAGNSARASWEGVFRSSGMSPAGYDAGGDAHDFDPGPGVDIYQLVNFPNGSTTISFQWDQPFFSVSGAPGSANDVDICVYTQPPGASPITCAIAGNVGADPVELVGISNSGPAASANIAIVKYTPAGGPNPGFMKYVAFRSTFSVTDPFDTTLASTSYGQNNAVGAIGVGAAFYAVTPPFGTSPALLESFSSAGGTPILFDASGALLGAPEIRNRPQFVGPDGTNTTFFGSVDTGSNFCCENDGFPNFFGTSASAPHAAGVAALMLQAFAGLTPDGVEDVLASSALDMGPAGFDFDSGAGFIDGNAAVGSVHTSTSCDGVADLVLNGTPNSGAGTFSATMSIHYSNGTFADITAYAPTHVFGSSTVLGDSSSFRTCP